MTVFGCCFGPGAVEKAPGDSWEQFPPSFVQIRQVPTPTLLLLPLKPPPGPPKTPPGPIYDFNRKISRNHKIVFFLVGKTSSQHLVKHWGA